MPQNSPGQRGRLVAATAVLATGLLLGVAACGSSSEATPDLPPEPTSAITVHDPWIKAADGGMTAAFGTIVNDGEVDVTIIGATTTISAVEIHEVVMGGGGMVMREKDDGLTVPAGATHILEPGGDHLMLMDLAEPVRPGDEITLTLRLDGGTTVDFTAVAKPFAGAEETYRPGGSAGQ